MTTRTRKQAGLVYWVCRSVTKGNSRAERKGMDAGLAPSRFQQLAPVTFSRSPSGVSSDKMTSSETIFIRCRCHRSIR
jgi:hypothetical protein